MKARSAGRDIALPRGWMPLTIAVAVGVGLVGMWKVHEFSAPPPVTTVIGPQAPEEFNPKHLTYEVFGASGQAGTLVYVDIEGSPHQVSVATLPWSHTETTTLTVVSGSISVHVSGGHVGCRMLVDGTLRDEQTNDHSQADVECRVKSA